MPDSARGPALTPQPISTAPQEDDRPLLLFCPEQGGWHTGEWYQGAWTDALTRVKNLDPTYWLDYPGDPKKNEGERFQPHLAPPVGSRR